MASPGSPALVWGFVLAISLVLLVPSASAQGEKPCFELFKASDGVKLAGYKDAITVDFSVRESTAEDALMYTLTWDEDCVDPPVVTDTTFTKYFTVNDTTACTWEITVNTPLTGLPDYVSQHVDNNKIATQVIFQGFDLYSQCTMTLTHEILDDNTQEPTLDQATYSLSIKEDFSPGYTISDFVTTVHDRDGTSPNNEFTVTMDKNCPLEATEANYISGATAAEVFYKLNEKLNFEDFTGAATINCQATFTNSEASPQLHGEATITITVLDVPDEPPVFTENFYYSEVSSAIYTGPLTVKPSSISATDGDTGINADITYKLTDVQESVGGTHYFAINSITGEVTLSKVLDDAFLLNERVLFFVTASDSSQTATALLQVILPPLPTTTASTEPATTCEPCTTPTYTTIEVTECPTCQTCPTDTTTEFTCPVVTCPTTPGECTCEPCTTASTTDFTCPVVTCPDVTCPTTPGECTCEPCTTASTTDFTCPVVTCPDITCPTTPGECTCAPCTTDSTTDFTCPTVTCPDVTCPTTPGECTTCEPCLTDTTTDFTCPDVTCPTTPSECTCEPCTTDATTDFTCPDVTCPTTPGMDTTITWGPDMPKLAFEQSSYAGTIFDQSEKVYQVKTNDVGYEVEYSWNENSESKKHFDINATTGWITVNKNNIPDAGLYELQAIATVAAAPSEQDKTEVNILVLSGQMVIENSVTRPSMVESSEEQDVTTFKLSQPAWNVCIIGVAPLDMKEHFEVDRQDDRNWKLRKTGDVNYEVTSEITLAVQAYTVNNSCPEIVGTIPSDLTRDQALAIITVTDTNDEKPVFSIHDLVVAYPTNEGLQRAVGPVVSVQAKDADTEQVTYSLEGADAGKFTVDEDTAEVYAVQGMDCEGECNFNVIASDDVDQDQLNVKVLPLGMENVFTLLMDDVTVSEVDAKLDNLSRDIGAQISKLYISPTQPTARGWRDVREAAEVSLEVHVYSIKDGSLMSLEALNDALDKDSEPIQAEEFMEAAVFESTEPTDTMGLTVAVGVLGALLGVVLIAGVGFFLYKKRKPSTAPTQPRSPTPINTLGQAYQNHSYEKEGYGTQGSLGHKTNGSLNGFTSVEVHSSQDSPPMYRSPLARPSDTIPLASIDQKEQQSSGLRRTNPSSPEYYGSSTPAPPPSFTRTTASSSSRPEPSSSSSSAFPIYAEVDKSKKTSPATSSKLEKSAPLSDFPASSTDKKPAVPEADYEEIGSTKFSSLKASPPPRRSSHHKSDDDDDDDVSGDVAYPGGKSAKFADEPAAGEEKKSVAFKVMVDTKEIEAQNMGPAQKKAEAEKLMEENRKKLQEEDNDEDEEETAKL